MPRELWRHWLLLRGLHGRQADDRQCTGINSTGHWQQHSPGSSWSPLQGERGCCQWPITDIRPWALPCMGRAIPSGMVPRQPICDAAVYFKESLLQKGSPPRFWLATLHVRTEDESWWWYPYPQDLHNCIGENISIDNLHNHIIKQLMTSSNRCFHSGRGFATLLPSQHLMEGQRSIGKEDNQSSTWGERRLWWKKLAHLDQ